jgi:hypothetical protein
MSEKPRIEPEHADGKSRGRVASERCQVETEPIEVEHDIWVQLPPTREFTMKVKVEFEGRGKPDPLPWELVGDEDE